MLHEVCQAQCAVGEDGDKNDPEGALRISLRVPTRGRQITNNVRPLHLALITSDFLKNCEVAWLSGPKHIWAASRARHLPLAPPFPALIHTDHVGTHLLGRSAVDGVVQRPSVRPYDRRVWPPIFTAILPPSRRTMVDSSVQAVLIFPTKTTR